MENKNAIVASCWNYFTTILSSDFLEHNLNVTQGLNVVHFAKYKIDDNR